MRIRSARTDDTPELYEIALATGNVGGDARALHRHPNLMGEVYVGPYLAQAPHLAFVIADDDDRPRGYVLGTPDTRRFETWTEAHWWPDVRRRTEAIDDATPSDEALLELIRAPRRAPDDLVASYPAHGHIDLLPEAQGQGLGRALLERLMQELASSGVTGLHLEMDPRNSGAQHFYARLGFAVVDGPPGSVVMARRLTPQ